MEQKCFHAHEWLTFLSKKKPLLFSEKITSDAPNFYFRTPGTTQKFTATPSDHHNIQLVDLDENFTVPTKISSNVVRLNL
jgi:hypothetical protein